VSSERERRGRKQRDESDTGRDKLTDVSHDMGHGREMYAATANKRSVQSAIKRMLVIIEVSFHRFQRPQMSSAVWPQMSSAVPRRASSPIDWI